MERRPGYESSTSSFRLTVQSTSACIYGWTSSRFLSRMIGPTGSDGARSPNCWETDMTHHPNGKIIAAYVRVSSDQQDSTRQRRSIEDWAKRNGVSIVHWFIDDKGKNPRDKSDKRLDFQRLLKLIRTGAVDVVVVDSQDRFGVKDNAEFWKYVSELRDNGCELWSVAQGLLSGEDDASVMVSTVGALTSTREQKEKGFRSLEGRIKTVRAGKYQGGNPPYGCDVVCYDASGSPKWRLIWTGNFQRLKINPDGTEQRFDGKNNLPGRDTTDVLRVQPSIRKDRLKVVRQIFDWYSKRTYRLDRLRTA